MSAFLDAIANPEPSSFGAESEAEAAAYDASITILMEGGTNFPSLDHHENLDGRVFPYSYGQGMQRFDITRPVTDRIKLTGYYPRINSGYLARATQKNGESVMYSIHDIEHDGDPKSTTLIAMRRGVDVN